MSDRIVESLNEMKQIYLESVSGNVILNRDEYLEYVEEKYSKSKKEDEDEKENDKEVEEKDEEEEEDEEEKPKRWWDDDGDGVGYEKDEVKGKFKKKAKKVDESFSDWRHDLYEAIGDIEDEIEGSKQKQIKERSNIHNKIDINPNVNIGEQVELSEEYIEEVIDIAAQYFYDRGLNDEGLGMVIEDLGHEKFLEYVFYISEDFMLTEARAAKRRKGGKSYEEIKAEIDAREAAKTKPTAAKKVTVSQGNDSVEKAVKTQPKSRPALDALARGITSATKFVQAGIERDRAARQGLSTAAKQTAQTAGRAVSGARKAGSELRKPFETPAGRNVQAALIKGARRATKAVVDTAARETAKRRVGVKEEIEAFLLEKSESQQQQKLFGLALSVKRGETPRSEVSQAVLDIVDKMSEAEIRKFAKTSHEGLPKKVED